MIKNLSYFFIYIISITFTNAQQWSTGEIILEEDFKVTFVTDLNTKKVTMTMVGPSDVWLGISPGSYGMADGGNDLILYHSSGLTDMKLSGDYSDPIPDEQQDWTIVTNTENEGVRTLIATRDINTGNDDDFIFPTTESEFPLLWAKGEGLEIDYHGSRGHASGSNTSLGAIEVSTTKKKVSFSPNSTSDFLHITTEIDTPLFVEIFNLAGDEIMKAVELKEEKLDVSNLEAGVYIVTVSDKEESLKESFQFTKE